MTYDVIYLFKNFRNSHKLHLWTDLHDSGCKWKILDDTILLYKLCILFMPMTSYYDVIKSSKIQNRLWRHKICHMGRITKILFFLKSTPQDGHFEVLIIQFGSETKKIYTKTYFDNASIKRRDFRFQQFLNGLDFYLYLLCLWTDFNHWYLKTIGLECSF